MTRSIRKSRVVIGQGQLGCRRGLPYQSGDRDNDWEWGCRILWNRFLVNNKFCTYIRHCQAHIVLAGFDFFRCYRMSQSLATVILFPNARLVPMPVEHKFLLVIVCGDQCGLLHGQIIRNMAGRWGWWGRWRFNAVAVDRCYRAGHRALGARLRVGRIAALYDRHLAATGAHGLTATLQMEIGIAAGPHRFLWPQMERLLLLLLLLQQQQLLLLHCILLRIMGIIAVVVVGERQAVVHVNRIELRYNFTVSIQR